MHTTEILRELILSLSKEEKEDGTPLHSVKNIIDKLNISRGTYYKYAQKRSKRIRKKIPKLEPETLEEKTLRMICSSMKKEIESAEENLAFIMNNLILVAKDGNVIMEEYLASLRET